MWRVLVRVRERSNLGYFGNKEGLGLCIVVAVGYEKIREGVKKV